MNIGMVVNAFPNTTQTFILNQITGIIDRGLSVQIISTHRPEDQITHNIVKKYDLNENTIYTHIPYSKTKQITGIYDIILENLLHNFNEYINIHKISENVRDFGLNIYFSRPFLNSKYDIVHCHFGSNAIRIADLIKAGIIDAPTLVSFHGAGIRKAQEINESVYQDVFDLVDVILANSKYTREQLIDFGADPTQVRIHPVGVDTGFFRPGSKKKDSDGYRILSVGRLVDLKGYNDGIQAIRQVLDANPELNITYRIVGDGPNYDKLESLIHRVNLEDTVYLCGEVPRNKIRLEMKKADVFLHPSHSEGLGMVLLEAQSTGLPIVATNVGGIPDAVIEGESAYLVPIKNPESLSRAIRKVLENPKLRERMGKIGRNNIKSNYDISDLNDRLVEIYNHLALDGY